MRRYAMILIVGLFGAACSSGPGNASAAESGHAGPPTPSAASPSADRGTKPGTPADTPCSTRPDCVKPGAGAGTGAAGGAGGAGGTKAGGGTGGGKGPAGGWTMFNYDHENTRNNRAETEITAANVAMLEPAWTVSMTSGVTSTPIVADGVVYVCDHTGTIHALDVEKGSDVWRPQPPTRPFRCGTPLVAGDRVYYGVGGIEYARSRATGELIWQKDISEGDMNTMLDSSPIAVEDKIIFGIANYEVIYQRQNYAGRGAVVALDSATGAERWRFWTTLNDASSGAGGSVWSSVAVDPKRRLVFIGTGQAYEPPAGPYTDALLAIDYESGKLIWHNQFHAGDVYADRNCLDGTQNCRDWDIGAAPNLFAVNGVDAVGVGSKGGLYRVVDRDTGANVIWERQVGPGSALGGVMAVAAVGDDAIYVSTRSGSGGTTLALDKATGAIIWQHAFSAPTWGALTLAGGVLYQPTRDGFAHALDIRDGTELWSGDLEHDAAGGLSIWDGKLFAPAGFTGLGTVQRAGASLTVYALNGTGRKPNEGGAGAGGMAASGASFGAVWQVLERNGCQDSFCHGNAGGLTLAVDKAQAWANLLGDGSGATAMGTDMGPNGEPACAGSKRVTPNDPNASVLYTKMADMPTCGARMPPSPRDYTVTAADLATLRAWIMAGAAND